MLAHRKKANQKRAAKGLGLFAWGPKVPNLIQGLFLFDCHDSLDCHPSDDADGNCLILRGRCFYIDHNLSRSSSQPRTNHDMRSASVPNHANSSGSGSSALPGIADDNCHGQSASPSSLLLEPTREIHLPSSSQVDVVTPSLQQVYQPSDRNDGIVVQENYSTEFTRLPHHESSDCEEPSRERNECLQQITDANIEEENMLQTVASAPQRIPDLFPWMSANRRWIELFYKHALKEVFVDEALDILGAPCKQWKTIVSNISRVSGLKEEMQVFAMCPGHMAYAPDPIQGEVLECCSECGNEAPHPLNADNSYTYFPILPRIRAMIAKENTCEELFAYRKSMLSDPNVCRDFYDGTVYQKICLSYGGESEIENDIFIIASTDGFSPFKNRNYDIWSIAAINLNLPPHQRYMPQNVLPLSFVPGPRQPKDIQSFLLPLVTELKMAIEGVMMSFPDGSQRLVRVHLVAFTGDQPAVCKVSGLIGHNGKTPCRDCTIKGYYSNHYYFPSKIYASTSRATVLFNPRQLPIRNESTTKDSIQLVENMTGKERKQLQTDLGIREDSVLFKLPAMVPYSSFPHDVMHTFYNVQNELLRIMLGSFNDEFSINRQLLSTLDEEFVSWKWGISGQLCPAPKPLSKYRDWKAAEHKMFSIAYSLVLFDGHLPRVYMDGLEMFSELVDICTRAEVTPNDMVRVRNVATWFYEHFERYYYRYRPDRVDFCKSVFHVLLHLADCMERFGPLIGVSQYWVEGYIGWMGQRNNSRIRPAQAMMKNALFGEAVKLYYDKMAYERSSCIEEVITNHGYILLGTSETVFLQELPRNGLHIREMIADYFCRKYDLSQENGRSISSTVTAVKFFARVRFIAGSEVQTASVYERERDQRKARKRSSCYIAAEMMSDDMSSEYQVWFGRLLKIMSFNIGDFEIEGHNVSGNMYDLVMVDWAQKLCKGHQGQVYVQGYLKEVFSRPTAEDVCVIKRLVKLVENRVPVNSTSNGSNNRRRRRTRTYILDDAVRVDHFLSETASTDGVKRVLHGFAN